MEPCSLAVMSTADVAAGTNAASLPRVAAVAAAVLAAVLAAAAAAGTVAAAGAAETAAVASKAAAAASKKDSDHGHLWCDGHGFADSKHQNEHSEQWCWRAPCIVRTDCKGHVTECGIAAPLASTVLSMEALALAHLPKERAHAMMSSACMPTSAVWLGRGNAVRIPPSCRSASSSSAQWRLYCRASGRRYSLHTRVPRPNVRIDGAAARRSRYLGIR